MSGRASASLILALLVGTACWAVHARELFQEGDFTPQPVETTPDDGSGTGQQQEGAADEGGEAQQIGGLVADLGCVRVNEVVHKPEDFADVKGVDFVELYNNCDEAVNLAGWSLADEKENTYVLGQDSCQHIVEGRSRIVFFRHNGCSFEFGFGGQDHVTLRDETTSIVDKVAWGKDNANKGMSWSRIPDGTGQFQDGKPTPGGENVAI